MSGREGRGMVDKYWGVDGKNTTLTGSSKPRACEQCATLRRERDEARAELERVRKVLAARTFQPPGHAAWRK